MYVFLRIVLLLDSFLPHKEKKKNKLSYLHNVLTFELLVSSLFSNATPKLFRTSEKAKNAT